MRGRRGGGNQFDKLFRDAKNNSEFGSFRRFFDGKSRTNMNEEQF